MPCNAHAPPVHAGGLEQNAQGPLRIVQALPHQHVAVQQPVAHGAVVLEPVVVIRLHAPHRAPPILEGDSVGRQNGEALTSERRPERLERVSHVAGHLAFAEVELAIVLVEDHDPAARVVGARREQESGDDVAFESVVLDALTDKAIALSDIAASELHRDRIRKRQTFPKHRADVGHHRHGSSRNSCETAVVIAALRPRACCARADPITHEPS
nr:hypothetical protein [Coralloluteibacterium stylophorae]